MVVHGNMIDFYNACSLGLSDLIVHVSFERPRTKCVTNMIQKCYRDGLTKFNSPFSPVMAWRYERYITYGIRARVERSGLFGFKLIPHISF